MDLLSSHLCCSRFNFSAKYESMFLFFWIVLAPFLEKTIFSPLAPLLKINGLFLCESTFGLYSVPLTHMSFFTLIPHCLNYYNIIVSL